MDSRGVAYYRARAEQGRDFSGLRFGNITPTDIDAFIDFGDRAFVFIEAKWGDGPLHYGQKLALQRLCDACESSGRSSIALVVRHDTPITEQVDFASCPVSEYRFKGQWRTPRRAIVTRMAVDKFIQWHDRQRKIA